MLQDTITSQKLLWDSVTFNNQTVTYNNQKYFAGYCDHQSNSVLGYCDYKSKSVVGYCDYKTKSVEEY